jgi:3-hydroxybutyryl-CoA dehydrogenase
MKLAILANGQQKEEWLAKPQGQGVKIKWVNNRKELLDSGAEAFFDLLFQPENNAYPYSKLNGPLFIHEVTYPFRSNSSFANISEIAFPLFRMNAWPTFLKREIVELSAFNKKDESTGGQLISALGWKYKFVPDIPGLITARVVSMIINEAYFTLEQEVSTKEEIDIAMKLGTNYPYGPFEWSEIIGLPHIYQLLIEMSKSDKKYEPCQLLQKEAGQQLTWH